ncbi:MAG: hypothetical protein R3Y63_12495 [Eubacteriales bacterium]
MKEFIAPQKEKTTLSPSIGADGEQSIHNNIDIVPQSSKEIESKFLIEKYRFTGPSRQKPEI